MSDSELRGFNASLPMALLSARESAMRLFRPMLAEHDLTEQQWRVLRALRAESEPVDVGALVAATSLLAPSLTRILTNLAERNLIDRTTHPDDQRRSLISLSEVGGKLVARISPESERIYGSIEDRFGQRRLAALIGELHELSGLLNSDEAGKEQ